MITRLPSDPADPAGTASVRPAGQDQAITDPASLVVGQTLHEYSLLVTGPLLEETSRLTGESSGRCLGVAFVIALRTVIDWGGLPGGAVMLGHRATWFRPVAPNTRVRTELCVARLGPRSSRYQEVTLGYESGTPTSRLMRQEQTVLWPREE